MLRTKFSQFRAISIIEGISYLILVFVAMPRQYMTFGGGFKYNIMQLDIAYLVPTVGNNHPLKNTLRLSLSFDFK